MPHEDVLLCSELMHCINLLFISFSFDNIAAFVVQHKILKIWLYLRVQRVKVAKTDMKFDCR